VNSRLSESLQTSLGASYTIERELPRGGMSRVFAATENALGRTVVIKVLTPELAKSLSAERFKREISLAARLQHPHIVPLLNAGQAAGSLYYTMPLVDGESLRERMSRERPMPIESVVRILEEISGALDYAHELGIVHRDIKPENVMFFHERAVVLDFGIGKALSAASADETDPNQLRITQRGMSLGTPLYIPPEQAAGDPGLDHRADIYSLGVVAYEMLTGHPPFSGRSVSDILLAHRDRIPESIVAQRPDTPPQLARVVMKCLEKKPADRPQSAAEIVRILRSTPSSATQIVGVPRALSQLPPWLPWALAGVMTLVAVALAVLVLVR
jgi:eukaryotic-like serine/threonine-protein kinase